MFTSKRGLFSSEHGATTSWLAGITSAALLVASIALPAVALDEGATPEPTAAAEEAVVAEEPVVEETPTEEAVVEETPAEDVATEEAVIDVPLEDEVVDDPAPAVAEDPAPPAEEPASEEPAPVEEKATASSTDGDTPDINSPPVEEYVAGVKVKTESDSATILWPEFGLDDNYTVQMEKKNGTWKTLDATVEDAPASSTRDYKATIDGLEAGEEYTVRIVTAETPELAASATEDAVTVDVSGPGRGSMARAAARSEKPGSSVVVSPPITFAAVVALADAASTPLPGGSTFEGGDGNLVVNDVVTPLVDWNSFTYSETSGVGSGPSGFGFTAAIDRPSGSTDNIFKQSTKEDDDPVETVLQAANDKSDLNRAYVATENKGGKTFLYLAFVREPSSDGTVTVSYELNQAGVPASNNAGCTPPDVGCSFPKRTPGDRLITYDFKPNEPVRIDITTWNGSEWVDQQIPPANLVQAQVNTAPVVDTVLGSPTSIQAQRFGELALNLTDVLADPTNSCQGFGSVTVKTKTSNSDTATLKDFIGPKPIVVGNCKLEVAKVVTPANDSGKFDLEINGLVKKKDAQSGDTTGRVPVTTSGPIPVAERAGTGTDLSDYTTGLQCKRQGENGESFPPSGVDLTGSLRSGILELTNGDDILCIFTNTRKTGKLEVVKDLYPSSDAGLFNLQIDAVTEATDVSDGGTTGEQTLNTGTHTVGETAGTGTDLGDYTKSIECKDENGSGDVVASDSGAGPLDVDVTNGSDIVCVITNTRKTGKLEVVKDLYPSSDAGLFNLQIDAVTEATDVSDGGTTGEQTLNTGTHTVGETAGTGTDLGDYTKSIECKDENGSGDVVASDSGAGPLDVDVANGSDIVCVITNTRIVRAVTLQKSWVDGLEDDSALLTIAGGTGGSNTSTVETVPTFVDDVNTATSSVLPGAEVKVTESLSGDGSYNSTLECLAGEDPVTVVDGVFTMPNTAVVCTFTNSRIARGVTLKKSWVNGLTGDEAALTITGGTGGSNTSTVEDEPTFVDNANTATSSVLPGTEVTVTELLDAVGSYSTGLVCTGVDGEDLDYTAGARTGSFTMPDEPVVCTYTNSRIARGVTLKKSWVNGLTGDEAALTITGGTGGSNTSTVEDEPTFVDNANTATSSVLPGTEVTVTELLDAVGSYSTGLVCTGVDGEDLDYTAGARTGSFTMPDEPVVCTYTNSRIARGVTLKKSWVNGLTGDEAALTITGGTGGSNTSTVEDEPTFVDNANTATSSVLPGTEVTVTELLGTEIGLYNTTLECLAGEDPVTVVEGLFTMPDSPVVCTFTNTRVDYQVLVSPDAENLVGTEHVFTVTVKKDSGNGDGFEALAGATPTITVDPAGDLVSQTCDDPGTDDNGQCTVTISSETTGKTTVTATYVGKAASSEFTRDYTDSGVKTWIDYMVNVTPGTAENLVGTEHVFTVTVKKDSGNGDGFEALAGATPTITVDPAGDLVSQTCDDPGTDDNGQCTVTISSETTGKTTVTATYVGKAASSEFTRDYTDSGVKTWIDYMVNVTPGTAENLVGTEHVFTVTVKKDSGNGDGFEALAGATPTITVDPAGDLVSQTCDDPGTDDNGQCTVTISSETTGKTTVTATYVGKAASSEFTRDYTDSGVKTWIDYMVNVTPGTAENLVGTEHVFTVTVKKDSGNGDGFEALAGATPTITVDPAGDLVSQTCDDPGTDDNGQCTVTISSETTGKTTVTATYVGKAASSEFTRDYTDSGVKTWIDYMVNVTPGTAENLVGTEHVFTVTVKKDSGNGDGFEALAGATPTITVDPAGDLVSQTCDDPGTDDNGQCTVTISSETTGKTTVTATYVGKAASSEFTRDYTDSGVKTWIDYMVNVTPESATNSIKDPHDFTVTVTKDAGDGEGFLALEGANVDISVSGSTGSITAIVTGSVDTPTSGSCTTDVNGQCVVTVNSDTDGSLTVSANFEGTAADSASREYSDSGVKTWTSGSIEVIKVDDNQTPMGNVTFELFSDANDNGVVDAGESLGQKTTLADGSVTWTDLVWADDYKVIEVSWPTGYVPSGALVTGPYTIDAENLLVTVNRVNNRIDIPKLDKFSVPAEGTAVQAGNTIAYTIEVKNDGALPLTGQTLLDTLPTGVALDVATVNPAGDTSVAGQITWKFDLGAYSAKTFTYTVTVTAGFGSPNLVNTATWVERKLTDKTEHPVLWPILSLDKTADPAEGTDVSPGNTITYSVLVTNTGAGSFSGPMVDTLPVGFTADAASVAASGGVLSADGRSITWTVTLAANSTATFTYSGTVDETATADLVNTVVLTTPTGPISDSTTHPIAPVAPIEEVVPPAVVGGTEDLAKTGADYIAPLVTAALLALLAGGLMVVFGRRRRYSA